MFKMRKEDHMYVDFLCRLRAMAKISTYDINMDLGRYFGYPKCCIKHFSNYIRMGIEKPGLYMNIMYGYAGTRYVRCPKCRLEKEQCQDVQKIQN